MKGLVKRKGSDNWQWLRLIPTGLWAERSVLISRGIKVPGSISSHISLRTPDRELAERRLRERDAIWQDELVRWRLALKDAPKPLSQVELDGIFKLASQLIDTRYPAGFAPERVRLDEPNSPAAKQAFMKWTDQHPEFYSGWAPGSRPTFAPDGSVYVDGVRAPDGFGELLHHMAADTLARQIQTAAEPVLQETLAQTGIAALVPGDRVRLLVDISKQLNRFRVANREATETRDYRLRNEVTEHYAALPDLPKKGKSGTASRGETIWDCFEHWKIEHEARGRATKTVSMYRGIIQRLVDYIGSEAVGDISHAGLRRWRLSLLAPDGSNPALSAKTVDGKYINAVKAVLSHRDPDIFPNNPAAELSTRTEARTKNRESAFTEQEAKKILSACRSEDAAFWGKMAEHSRFACRWAPWMMAFSGARIGEIIQLRKTDFKREGEVDYIHITPEAGQVKTRKYRNVPLHPQLIKMGILGEVLARPGDRVFVPPGVTDIRERVESISGTVGTFVRERVGITDEGVAPNHGWRYWFYDRCDLKEIDDRHSFAITGHSRIGGSGYSYQQLPNVSRLAEKMKSLPWVELEGAPAHQGEVADYASK